MSIGGVGGRDYAAGLGASEGAARETLTPTDFKSSAAVEVARAMNRGASFDDGAMGGHCAALIHLLTSVEAYDGRLGETIDKDVIQAVRDFQKKNGLEVTGQPNAETLHAFDKAITSHHESPEYGRYHAWRKFDGDTQGNERSLEVHHGQSAVENLKEGAGELLHAPVFLAKGIASVFGPNDMLDGTNNGIVERLSNPVLGAAMAGMALFVGLKDIFIDAPVHAIAGLFDR